MKPLAALHRVIVTLAAIAVIVAALVLTYSVVIRYLSPRPTDWQDELSVFLLIGVTFLSAAWVHTERGHIGIEVMHSLLPPGVDRLRQILVDLASAVFCAFFSWKSWTLFYEAWDEGHVSSSSWAPPLWIPYLAMAAGMTLLTLQILVQAFARTPRVTPDRSMAH